MEREDLREDKEEREQERMEASNHPSEGFVA